MSSHLFLGGPQHGKTLDTEGNPATWRVIHMPTADFGTLSGRTSGAEIHQYVRRDYRARITEAGDVHVRTAYVHEDIQTSEHGYHALAQHLVSQWILAGFPVIEGEVISDDGG